MGEDENTIAFVILLGALGLGGLVGGRIGCEAGEDGAFESKQITAAYHKKLEDGTEGIVVNHYGSPNTILLKDSDGIYKPISEFERLGKRETEKKYSEIEKKLLKVEEK